MIQFNLLPDVKLDYIKTRRTKRLVVIVSLTAAAISLAVLIIMFLTVQVAQKKHLNDISKDIKTQEKTLTSTTDLNKILTIQNQLGSLPALHQGKPISSRLLGYKDDKGVAQPGYIQQVTPVQANISKLDVDFVLDSITITGSADDLAIANKYADTLKFATFTNSTVTNGKPFTNIVSTLSRDDKKASFILTFNFDPALFSNTETPILTVPKITSTRSETEKPEAVFKASTTDKTGGIR